jgi:hypothetical protein
MDFSFGLEKGHVFRKIITKINLSKTKPVDAFYREGE